MLVHTSYPEPESRHLQQHLQQQQHLHIPTSQPQPQPQHHHQHQQQYQQHQQHQQFPSLMPVEQSAHSWFSSPSSYHHHHRESSLSSLGSAGPASPYTTNTSNPQVAGDLYHDFQDYDIQDYHQPPAKQPLTPIHTPLPENLFASHNNYAHFYQNPNPNTMAYPIMGRDAELMPAPELNHSGRHSLVSVASHDSPSTPQSYDGERQKNGYHRNSMPKLDRTMTDVYADELYNPNFQITSASPAPALVASSSLAPQQPHDIFSQRLQAANSQHLSASNTQIPLPMPSRGRSPFRQGSPLAPTGHGFGPQSPSVRFGTATQMREKQKAENDARAMQEQMTRGTSSNQAAPTTISPKDVDLVYHESEEDADDAAAAPFSSPPSQQRPSANYPPPPAMAHEPSEQDDLSQHSYGSMATTRRESSSAYSTTSTSQGGVPQNSSTPFNFAAPVRPIPQQYPFVPQSHRRTRNMAHAGEDFPMTDVTSMEAGGGDTAGTYTCTYHGCSLRFDAPAKLQQHKREGHRHSATATTAAEDGGSGMTSAAQRNSQAGPHKCERINPSTGKPCNTVFSRPYDLTRHEDTIHNARKQKVHCPLCTEEKTFSRSDALTRHLRVVHPEYVEATKGRRRGAHAHS